MGKQGLACALAAVVAWSLLPGEHAAADMEVATQTPVVKVLECLGANSPAQLTVDTIRVQSKGTEVRTPELEGRLLVRRDEHGLRVRLDVQQPASFAGARYLLVSGDPDDELYVYLPALHVVRRVRGATG